MDVLARLGLLGECASCALDVTGESIAMIFLSLLAAALQTAVTLGALRVPGVPKPLPRSRSWSAQLASLECIRWHNPAHPSSPSRRVGAKRVFCAEPTCSICCGDFEEDEDLRVLRCRHVFHRTCIDQWVRVSGATSACPLCKCAILASAEPPCARALTRAG